jgi:hypothetical protein
MPKGIEDKSRANRKPRGRASKVDEEKTTKLALKALKDKFGTLDMAFAALLESGKEKLILFVYEHALGKPKEKKETKVDVTVNDLRIGYGGQTAENDEDESDIQEAEIVEETEIKHDISLPGNED